MIEQIKKKITEIIDSNQIVWLWNQQNLDIYKMFLMDVSSQVVTYKTDDKLLSNYTKILSFFNANIEENITTDTIGIEKTPKENVLCVLQSIWNHFFHRNYIKIKHQFSNYYFTNQEINLMTKIYKLNLKKETRTIIINNLDLANDADIIFIKKLVDSGFFELYASNIKLIITLSSSVLKDLELSKIVEKNYYEIVVSEDELCRYFKKLYGINTINQEKIKQYLRLCNNDFNLIDIIIDTIKTNTDSYVNDEYEITIERIVKHILDENPGLNALHIAAVIGLSFDIATMNEISNYPTTELISQVKYAYDHGLIIKIPSQEYNYSFISELIRKIIYESGNIDVQWHINYAQKLGKTTPYEFALISKHYYLGNDIEKSIVNYIANLIICTIDHKPLNNNDPYLQQIEKCICSNITLSASFNQISSCLIRYDSGNISPSDLIISEEDCLTYIDKMINFTKAVIIYHGKFSTSENAFIKLADCLSDLYKYFSDISCTGLQIRCCLYLIDIYSYRINELENAKKQQQELEYFVNQILVSQNMENQTLRITLRRKTAVWLSPEIAHERLKNLLLECINENNSLDDYELFKLTNDYLGYALYSGSYYDMIDSIETKIVNYLTIGNDINYPKLYKLEMNYILYKIFNKKIKIADLEKWLIKKESEKTNTSTMYKYDLAAIGILCNHLNFAEKILLKLYEDLKNNNTCFYNYCYNANLSSLYLLKRDFDKAKFYNDLIINSYYSWEIDFINIMKYRAQKMNEYISSRVKFTAKDLYECFDHTPIYCSNVWKFLGKGILFSELMFYRE